MKVLDLGCDQGHAFEGWFASEEDYAAQQGSGLLECPLCGTRGVHKRLSAPRLNLRGGSASENMPTQAGGTESAAALPPSPEAAATMALMHEAWLKAVHHVIRNTEDVGERFVEEARRIHYGETPERGIRGQATQEDRQALQEEGIEVMPLPLPKGLQGPVQ